MERFCVQRSQWLMPQVALLHTWVGEDQCRVTPYKDATSPTPQAIIIIIIIIIICYHLYAGYLQLYTLNTPYFYGM
jgi:hypothetical protein